MSKLNENSSADNDAANLITLRLIGASTSDLEFNPKSEWKKFDQSSYLVINKATNQGKLHLPDFNQNLTFEVLDIKVNQGNGYSINTLELDSNNFISVLNVYKEGGLWILWGTKGEKELIIFQSLK